MKKVQKFSCFLLSLVLLIATVFGSTSLLLKTNAATIGYVNATNVNIREDATTASKSKGMVSNCYVTIIGSKNPGDGYTWYNITYNDAGNTITGYIRGDLIEITTVTEDSSFEKQLEAFPESYRDSLKTLHSLYPNWSFYADNVNMTLSEAVAMQMPNRRKEVQTNQKISWRSMGQDAYNWSTGEWAIDNGSWVSASREVITYYMDPRNFLDATYIYTFMQQSYNAQTQTAEGVSKIIKGKFLENGYSDPSDTAYGGSYVNVIMEAARQSNVNPYVIAATILQEQGSGGTSALISGTTSYGKYYNFFNVGASGGTEAQVIANGLAYAKSAGWTTRSASIIGGAKFCGNSYIDGGQDTYYYMNFNVLNPDRIWKQYAQAVFNAANSGKNVSGTYSSNRDSDLTFRIPVFKDMPSTVSACPQQNSNRNNYYFTSINVSGLTPSFTMFNYNYDLRVTGNTTINVTVPTGATITSPATYSLSPGESKVVLTVRSESGYTTDYTINVNATTSCTISVPGGVGSSTTTPDTTPTTVIRGDTNGDGKVSLIDLANVQKHLLNIKILTGDNFTGADTNSDGKISLIDLANVQKHLLGIKLLNQ